MDHSLRKNTHRYSEWSFQNFYNNIWHFSCLALTLLGTLPSVGFYKLDFYRKTFSTLYTKLCTKINVSQSVYKCLVTIRLRLFSVSKVFALSSTFLDDTLNWLILVLCDPNFQIKCTNYPYSSIISLFRTFLVCLQSI